MSFNESDTRSKLIDPAIFARGWAEADIKREVSAGAIAIIGGKARRQAGKIDYLLRIKVNIGTQPVAMAILEAKAEHLPPGHGLQQARGYAETKRFNVPFVFASNGHQFVEFDRTTGLISPPRPMDEFPTPQSLQERYERLVGFALSNPAARPLLTPYPGGEAHRRYYQDAAIRAVFEKIARATVRAEPPRALLSLATGAGKTFIAVNLLKRIAESGEPLKALFICDRDELRTQASGAFQNVFGSDAAPVSASQNQKNARVLIATYQTLDVASDDADANFLTANYPPNYFTHIVIDECHRSAWGKWSQVLTRNPNAVQVGLTATPRQLTGDGSQEATADAQVSADNVRHFGDPVYEYEIGQGIEDGYLAACEIHRSHINIDGVGIALADLRQRNPIDANTGQPVSDDQLKTLYERGDFERGLLLPDRVRAMCADLFGQLLEHGSPEQKTIIFCVRDRHADDVATAMNNLYAAWCAENGIDPMQHYAFKCTAASDGNDYLADLRGSGSDYFVATTVDLLTTGVDVPVLQNVVFFKYIRSPIAFYQMIGRGTRIDIDSGKLMFRVYDYTNATRLFGEDFFTHPASRRGDAAIREDADVAYDPFAAEAPGGSVISAEGFDVQVGPDGTSILTNVNGKAQPVPLEVYKQMLAEQLIANAPTLDVFREIWVKSAERTSLLAALPDGGRSASIIRTLEGKNDFDLYDVLAELGYAAPGLSREQRAAQFEAQNTAWLQSLDPAAAATIRALVALFSREGVEELEKREVFSTPSVKRAGGFPALRAVGKPGEVVEDTKRRIFAA